MGTANAGAGRAPSGDPRRGATGNAGGDEVGRGSEEGPGRGVTFAEPPESAGGVPVIGPDVRAARERGPAGRRPCKGHGPRPGRSGQLAPPARHSRPSRQRVPGKTGHWHGSAPRGSRCGQPPAAPRVTAPRHRPPVTHDGPRGHPSSGHRTHLTAVGVLQRASLAVGQASALWVCRTHLGYTTELCRTIVTPLGCVWDTPGYTLRVCITQAWGTPRFPGVTPRMCDTAYVCDAPHASRCVTYHVGV